MSIIVHQTKSRTFLSTLLISLNIASFAAQDLDTFAGPEHWEDGLYNQLYLLAKNEPISNILEIGSSCGWGTTEALVLGIIQNKSRPTLFCLEISKFRSGILSTLYGHLPSVKYYCASSVSFQDFMLKDELIDTLMCNPGLTGRFMSAPDFLNAWERDTQYAYTHNVPLNGIELIKKEHAIDNFDMVFIDGSAFTAVAELKLIYGASIIVLQGIDTIKNHVNYATLCNDPAYELIEKNNEGYNSYAVFKRKKLA